MIGLFSDLWALIQEGLAHFQPTWDSIPMDYKVGVPLGVVAAWFISRPMYHVTKGLFRGILFLVTLLPRTALDSLGFVLLPVLGAHLAGGGKISPFYAKNFLKFWLLLKYFERTEADPFWTYLFAIVPGLGSLQASLVYQLDPRFKQWIERTFKPATDSQEKDEKDLPRAAVQQTVIDDLRKQLAEAKKRAEIDDFYLEKHSDGVNVCRNGAYILAFGNKENKLFCSPNLRHVLKLDEDGYPVFRKC